jgi:hypothetical protein
MATLTSPKGFQFERARTEQNCNCFWERYRAYASAVLGQISNRKGKVRIVLGEYPASSEAFILWFGTESVAVFALPQWNYCSGNLNKCNWQRRSQGHAVFPYCQLWRDISGLCWTLSTPGGVSPPYFWQGQRSPNLSSELATMLMA